MHQYFLIEGHEAEDAGVVYGDDLIVEAGIASGEIRRSLILVVDPSQPGRSPGLPLAPKSSWCYFSGAARGMMPSSRASSMATTW